MLNFLKEKMLDLLYGEKFIISAKDAKKLIAVDRALHGHPFSSQPTTVVTGDDVDVIAHELQPQQRWTDKATIERGIYNLVVPAVVFQF